MNKSRRFPLVAGLLGTLLLAPCFAQAQATTTYNDENPSAMAMTFDLLLARPIGLVTTVGGSALFLVTLPFTAAGGNVQQAGETLVAGPARATFVRCLGCVNPGRKHHTSTTQ